MPGRRLLRPLLFAATALFAYPAPSPAQFPGGPPLPGSPGFPGGGRGGPGAEPTLEIVARFDRDGDKRLDADERQEAMAWLARQRPPGNAGGRAGRGVFAGSPGIRLAVEDVRRYGNEPFYDPATLRTIFIGFDNRDWEPELEAFYNTDVEVPATVTIDGRSFRDVGVSFRGASSFRMVPAGSKRPLKLSLDWLHDDQEIGGYRTLNLLNANGDPTFLRAVLYSEIARDYIPAPKVNLVRVVINGENWGIYASAQQFNKDFLRDFFGTTEGARWKVPGSPNGQGGMEYLGENIDAYRRIYEIKSKDDAARWADLIQLFRVLNQTPADRLVRELEPILDIDGALRFLALEVALVNTDGYWTRASDYSIYQSPDGRFHVIPHDMNEGLGAGAPGGGGAGGRGGPPPGGFGPGGPGGFGRGGPGGPGGPGEPGGGGVALDPLVGLNDATKPLRSRLLAVPELRDRYLEYVRDIATRWLSWETLGPRVASYSGLIAEDVRIDTRKLYGDNAFEQGLGELQAFTQARRGFLLR